ncbi:hypothetical protein [Paenibacillus xylaniclasticus]|uniref:hypothetical protein n=1 Tax=Paenibacillus xylaniclasticus TaxID=588083 RepID=UPI000FDACB50|nr:MULTISPECIES: hypothetical protein [Paenibacillus]GFN34090.1 hypothetical protein PCURB6_43500 [Paenibacillus curdlanolyticus]
MRIMIVVLLLATVLAGCGDGKHTKEPYTMQQVLDALQAEGLQLTDDAPVDPDDIFQQGVDEVKPQFYRLGDGVIYIYVFETNDKRVLGYEKFYDRTLKQLKAHHSHEANNVFIIYTGGQQQGDSTNDQIRSALKRLE